MIKPRVRVKAVMRNTAAIVQLAPNLAREHHRLIAIERIEETLKQAMDGEIIGVAIAGVRPNGAITTAWGGLENANSMLGGLILLSHRISKVMSE